MAKGGKSKEKHGHGKTLDDWVAKGWGAEVILAGSVESDEIHFDPATEEFELFGQVFGATGAKLTGRDRPHIGTEVSETGVIVTLSKPAGEDITVLYKIEPLGEDDEDLDEGGVA